MAGVTPSPRTGRLACKHRIFILLGALPPVKFFIPEGLSLKSSTERTYKDESHGVVAPWLLVSFSPDLRIAICVGRSGRFVVVSKRRLFGFGTAYGFA